MNIKFDFTGKCIVVTGGARGIGLQIARRFLEAGAKLVVIWDFSFESLESAKRELKLFTEHILFQQVDVAKFADCEQAAKEVPTPIDILINNAGITRDKSLTKMSPDEFATVIDTNLSGVFFVSKSLLEKFNPNSQAKRIINISSVVALYGNFGQTNYVAAKAGVIGMTKTWARELARKGFTVNAIAPGFTLTPMVEAMPAEARKAVDEKIPVGRMAKPDDIANACLFLASAEAGYVNGAVLGVDGGLVC